MGAPVGNQNAAKAKEWRAAIRRALAHRHGSYDEGLTVLAAKLVEAAEAGDMQALKEIGDREDGKPQQSIDAQLSGSLTGILESLPVSQRPDKSLDR